MSDLISRRAAIEIVDFECGEWKGLAKTIEKRLSDLPSAQPELIRCKDCKWWGYDDDDGAVRVCHAAKHGHMSSNWSIMIYRTHKGDFYCADAERKEGESE